MRHETSVKSLHIDTLSRPNVTASHMESVRPQFAKLCDTKQILTAGRTVWPGRMDH